MQSRLCSRGHAILMFWKHLGVFWEHLGVFWGHFGGKRGRHTSAGWPPGGRRMASISLGVLLGSLCLASCSTRQVRTPTGLAKADPCLGNIYIYIYIFNRLTPVRLPLVFLSRRVHGNDVVTRKLVLVGSLQSLN